MEEGRRKKSDGRGSKEEGTRFLKEQGTYVQGTYVSEGRRHLCRIKILSLSSSPSPPLSHSPTLRS